MSKANELTARYILAMADEAARLLLEPPGLFEELGQELDDCFENFATDEILIRLGQLAAGNPRLARACRRVFAGSPAIKLIQRGIELGQTQEVACAIH
jgi:hypothetical protein